MDRRAHPRRAARARAFGVGALTCLVGTCVGGAALAQEAPGQPTPAPQATASASASAAPDPTGAPAPTAQPTTAPAPSSSVEPTAPAVPTTAPSATPAGQPTPAPTAPSATPAPSASPTSSPAPSRSPSASPTRSAQPTPTREPTREPTQEPTRAPAPQPSATGGSGGAGGAPSSGGSDGGSAASDVAPGRQEAAVPYTPGTREPQARVEGTGGSSTRPQARGRADEHGGFSPLREHGGEPTLAGVSGWVSYYLDRDDGSARSDRTSGGAPVDSNDNAGVQAVRGESGDAGLSTEAGAGTPDLSALRGPIPIIVFSALALGGIVLVIHRSSRTLGGPRRAGRR